MWVIIFIRRKKGVLDNETEFGKYFLTTTRVGRRCSVSRFTVLKWIKQGRIEAVKLPERSYRIPASEAEFFAKTLSQERSNDE